MQKKNPAKNNFNSDSDIRAPITTIAMYQRSITNVAAKVYTLPIEITYMRPTTGNRPHRIRELGP